MDLKNNAIHGPSLHVRKVDGPKMKNMLPNERPGGLPPKKTAPG